MTWGEVAQDRISVTWGEVAQGRSGVTWGELVQVRVFRIIQLFVL